MAPRVRAGLTLEMHLYYSQGQYFAFYTPLLTNDIAPAAALGTYVIRSPGWPTNGSQRGFDLTTNGINDRYEFDGEFSYSDLAGAMSQITNGTWSIIFTNATITNQYDFTVSAPTADSNTLPATTVTFPTAGSYIFNSQANFTWQAPSALGADAVVSAYNYYDFYQTATLPATQTNWNVPVPIPAGTNFTFLVQYYLTNSFFSSATPLDTNNSQPISGWSLVSIMDSSASVSFDVGPVPTNSAVGHTCFAWYTFEDNNLFAKDFSGNGNTMGYSWFGAPPHIVTNDAVSGTYAGGFGGSGWFDPPDGLRSMFAGSFSVSLWLKTTNVFGSDNEDVDSAAGIVSVLNNNYDNGVVPMAQAGSKLVFYTGGSLHSELYSHARINTGSYVHVVTTRDQQTGEKRIYINGVLDASAFSDTNLLDGSGPDGLTIGYNNDNVFTGEMDEIQFYSGVLSSNEVTYLYNHPGTNVADILQLDVPAGRYDFEVTNEVGMDSSGHNNNANCGSSSGPQTDVPSTDAAIGMYARQFFGDTSFCFTPGAQAYTSLSNALAGSFSVTAWVNTTNSVDADFANAFFGMPVVMIYNTNTNGAVPLSITGSKAAFTVSNPSGTDTTIHSTTSVNDGRYHFLAVTRNQANGLMSLYVDGALEATDICNTAAITVPSTINVAGGYYFYQGLLDDVRIYKGVLTPDDIATLASSSSQTENFGDALGTSGLAWIPTGDANWFIESTNTYNGAALAAQSGSVTNYQSTTLSVTVTGPGKLDFYWSSIANDPNNGFDCEFYIDDPFTNDIADLYGDNDWQSIQDHVGGPVVVPPGRHTLNWVVYANGDSDPTEAGFLDQVMYEPAPTDPVSAEITLNVYREQDPTFGDICIVFPSFNSVTPAPTGTTTNTVESPSGSFSGHVAPGGDAGSGSTIFNTLAQVLNECTNGLWSLYINKGTTAERRFQFSMSISGLTTNLLSAVNIITPTNNATGVPANTPFQWTGPVGYSSLNVSEQKTDGSGKVFVALAANATNWPSPPLLAGGTNRFDITYVSNNFPTVAFSVPADTMDSQTASNFSAQVNLNSTATSIFVVTAGAAPVQLLNAAQSGNTFQFQFQSQAGFTNSVQYRTNLTAGNNWQTYTNVAGDGALKTIPIPLSIFDPSLQGFIRVLTQ